MRRLRTEDKIRELLARFATEAKLASAMGRYDPHRVSEDLLVPLFKIVFGYKSLRNLNQEEENYPAIDLADDEAGVAIQISATRRSDKIKETLQKFVKHELYLKYRHLKVYVLTEKQQSYSGAEYDQIIGGRFSFDKDKDIWDFTTVGEQLKKLDDRQLNQVLKVLESYFSDSPLIFGVDEGVSEETVWLNLLEISFPDRLFLADIDLDRDSVIRESRNYSIKLNWRSSTRHLIRAALEQRGLRFAVDWVDYEGKILTFHDLEDHTLPLNKIIDQGTLTVVSPDEFYEIDENQERVFKSLLRRCLQQKLYHQHVKWQNQENLFFFTAEDDVDVRLERWPGNPHSGREVFKRIPKKNNPEETYYYKHLAFRTGFQRFGNSWYLQIIPDWFFSNNRYRRSFYHEDNLNWVKRREKNSEVFNQLRFIVHFLKSARQLKLFSTRSPDIYPFLSFGELLQFSAPALIEDKDWLSRESKEQEELLTAQKQLEFLEE